MNTNAAAFAFILQQRRDLSASQSQTNNTSAQRQSQPLSNHSRSSTGNIPGAPAQYQQYAPAPYQQDVYSNQQAQQTRSYSAPPINPAQNYSQFSQPAYQPAQYGWQPQYQHQQQQPQQINQQSYPGAQTCYQPSSSSLSQYNVPALPFQSSPVENSYLNQSFQYPYGNQIQSSQFQGTNSMSAPLTAMPGISNQYNQFLHNKMPQIGVGIGICKSNVKNVLDGSDMSMKNTEHKSSNILPPSQLFFCEGCEKEFTQKSAYDAHCANHETCRHPGCSFSGTKKVVIAHFHGSHGLYSGEGYKMIEVEGSNKKYRVLLGVSPIEIEKWRMDRRKNFPTSENTQKKLEQKEELRKAGGLVIEKGKKRKRNDTEQGQGQSKKNTDDSNSSLNANSSTDQVNNIVDENGMIVGGKNNESIEGEHKEDKNDKGEEDGEENKDFKLRKKPCVFFVKGTCKQGDSCTYSHDFEIKVCNFFVRSGRCTRGNKCTFSHDKEERAKFLEEKKLSTNNGKKSSKSENQNDDKNKDEDNEDKEVDNDDESKEKNRGKNDNKLNKNKNKDKDKGQNRGNMKEKEELNDDVLRQKAMKKKGQLFLPKPFAGGSRGTLLRNLLLHEVEVEENILLQCLRLIVTNNYLQPVE